MAGPGSQGRYQRLLVSCSWRTNFISYCATTDLGASDQMARPMVPILRDIYIVFHKTASDSRTNHFEDTTTGDRSTQFVVSTPKDLVSAKRITSGSNSLQVLGQTSDDSLQQMLREGDKTKER